MDIKTAKKLKFGDIVECDFSKSSPVYEKRGYGEINYYHGPLPHPALYLAQHEDKVSNQIFLLLCPMSSKTEYANFDPELIILNTKKDIQKSTLDKDIEVLNCRILISVSINQLRCSVICGIINSIPLNLAANKIKTHLKEVNNYQVVQQ